MSKHFPVFTITGNYQWILTEIIFHFRLDLIVFRLQQFVNTEITYVRKYLKRKWIFFSTLLIHHCERNIPREKHDITDSLSHAVVLENGGV